MQVMIWLEVAIGLALLYLLLSFVASGFTELVAALLRLRARDLSAGLRELLGPEVQEKLKNHPLLAGLGGKSKQDPSYIPSRLFVLALLDLRRELSSAAQAATDAQSHRANLTHVLDLLGVKEGLSGEALEQALKNLTLWFDNAMQRLSGAYKRRAHLIILGFGALLAFALNADTIRIAQKLYSNGPMRAAVVAAIEKELEAPLPPVREPKVEPPNLPDAAGGVASRDQGSPAGTVVAGAIQPASEPRKDAPAPPIDATHSGENKAVNDIKAAQRELQARIDMLLNSQLPLGWEPGYWDSIKDLRGWLMLILGMLLTTFAVSLGAPFWFEILSRLVNLRSTAKELVAQAKDK